MPRKTQNKRQLSPEAKANIIKAAKKRWAKYRKDKKAASLRKSGVPVVDLHVRIVEDPAEKGYVLSVEPDRILGAECKTGFECARYVRQAVLEEMGEATDTYVTDA